MLEEQNKIIQAIQKNSFEAAKYLLGKIFRRTETKKGKKITYEGIITEIEIYTEYDKASHSYNGKITPRNMPMFKEGGHLYVYFTYGMYHCCNIVTNKKGIGEALLLRELLPIKNIAQIFENRFKKKEIEFQKMRNLLNGPAKICLGFNISKKDNGKNLCSSKDFFLLDYGIKLKEFEKLKRVGISKDKDKLWRYKAKKFEWNNYKKYFQNEKEKKLFEKIHLKKYF